MNGNCVRGDQCWNFHSWFCGDGFLTIVKLQGHKKAITGIALPVGSDKLYTASSDGTVRLWDCHTGKCANVINIGADIGSLISEGPWVFVGVPNAVKGWNTQTSAEFVLNGPHKHVFSMFVANATLFVGTQGCVILAWRASSKTNSPFELVATLSGHSGAGVCLAVGGKMLYSGSMDRSIKGVLVLRGTNDAEAKPLSFCSCNDNSVHIYDLPSFSERGRLFAKQEVRAIEIGPGGLFFTGDRTGSLMVWKWLEDPKVAAFS